MEYIKISEEQLNDIIKKESNKLVGIILKRYEIIPDKNILKAEIKELIYEAYRNIKNIIVHCAKSNYDIHLDFNQSRDKKGESNGKQ